MPKDMTIALGSLPATPLQMVSGYAVFANGGFRVDSYLIDRIEDATGKIVFEAHPKIACEACEAAHSGAPAGGTAVPVSASEAHATVDPGTSGAAAPTAGSSADPDHAPPNALPWLIAPAQLAPRVISPQNTWVMDDMMADVIKRGTGIRAGLALHRVDISGKTGTTNEARDTWFNGFNRNIVATVWVGYDQERPLGEGEEGSRTAVPIWIDFMREALRAQPDRMRPMPAGLVTARISPRTGALAAANESDAIYETFMEDRMPTEGNAVNTLQGASPQNPGSNSEPLF
jgi:penicillin-binding protein 1A